MTKRVVDRQYPLVAYAKIGAGNQGAGNGLEISVPSGAVVLRVAVQTAVAFNGTTPTLTVGDGTTVFANAVDVSSVGAETVTNAPKVYPTGGVIAVAVGGTGATAGEAHVVVEYVRANRGQEIQE